MSDPVDVTTSESTSGSGDGSAITGPLSHLVEQLWAPALATGRARLRVGDEAVREDGDATRWTTAEEYLVVPSVGRASMLLPSAPRRATAGALMNYRGLRRRVPNLQRTLLGSTARAGAPLPFPRLSVQVDARAGDDRPELPLALLSGRLGVQVFASIGVRTGANRKATLQLVDATGTPRGFAKMAWGPSSSDGVRREAHALCTPLLEGPVRSPEVLATGEFHGFPYLVTSPLPLGCRGVRADVPAPTPQEVFALCPVVRHDRISSTGQLRALRARVAGAHRDGDSAPVLDAAAALLDLVDASDVELPVTRRWHGDLTPWNCARDTDGTLWCWDWESSEPDAVAGLDALHWHATVSTEGGRRLDGSVLEDAHRDAQSLLVAAGIARPDRALVTALYAATLAERACEWSRDGGWEAGWVLPGQLVDLLTTARRLVEGA